GHLAQQQGHQRPDRQSRRRADVQVELRRCVQGRCTLEHRAGAGWRSVRLGRSIHLYQESALLRRHDARAAADFGHFRRALPGAVRRFDHHRSHFAGRFDQEGFTGRQIPDGTRRGAEGFQLLWLAPRQRRRDGARHLRQHPHQEQDAGRRGRWLHAARTQRRTDGDLRRRNEIQTGEHAAGGDRRQGIRHRFIARLGSERHAAPGREGRDRRKLRTHPPFQPGRHGRAAADVHGRRKRADVWLYRPGRVLDHRTGRRQRAYRAGHRARRQRWRKTFQGARDAADTERTRVLPARRHPAIRAARSGRRRVSESSRSARRAQPSRAVATPPARILSPGGAHLVHIRLVRQQAVGFAAGKRQGELGDQPVTLPFHRNRPDQHARAVFAERSQLQHLLQAVPIQLAVVADEVVADECQYAVRLVVARSRGSGCDRLPHLFLVRRAMTAGAEREARGENECPESAARVEHGSHRTPPSLSRCNAACHFSRACSNPWMNTTTDPHLLGETMGNSSERPWLTQYPPGVPAEIDVNAYASVVSIFEEACTRYANNTAFTSFGATLDYARLDRLSANFAAFLTNEWKLGKGDRVAIMLPNLLQYPVALFGALRAGCTVVNVNPLYTARELEHQLRDSGAKAIVVLENFASTLASVLHDTPVEHVLVTSIGDLLGFPKG